MVDTETIVGRPLPVSPGEKERPGRTLPTAACEAASFKKKNKGPGDGPAGFSSAARVLSISCAEHFRKPGVLRGAYIPMAGRQGMVAEDLRQRALMDVALRRYAAAYRKIVEACRKNPYSLALAKDRSYIAGLYQRRLEEYIYIILVPWLPLLVMGRFFAAGASPIGVMPNNQRVLFSALVVFGVAMATALRLHYRKNQIC